VAEARPHAGLGPWLLIPCHVEREAPAWTVTPTQITKAAATNVAAFAPSSRVVR
jgi:hypothetical protein